MVTKKGAQKKVRYKTDKKTLSIQSRNRPFKTETCSNLCDSDLLQLAKTEFFMKNLIIRSKITNSTARGQKVCTTISDICTFYLQATRNVHTETKVAKSLARFLTRISRIFRIWTKSCGTKLKLLLLTNCFFLITRHHEVAFGTTIWMTCPFQPPG